MNQLARVKSSQYRQSTAKFRESLSESKSGSGLESPMKIDGGLQLIGDQEEVSSNQKDSMLEMYKDYTEKEETRRFGDLHSNQQLSQSMSTNTAIKLLEVRAKEEGYITSSRSAKGDISPVRKMPRSNGTARSLQSLQGVQGVPLSPKRRSSTDEIAAALDID